MDGENGCGWQKDGIKIEKLISYDNENWFNIILFKNRVAGYKYTSRHVSIDAVKLE